MEAKCGTKKKLFAFCLGVMMRVKGIHTHTQRVVHTPTAAFTYQNTHKDFAMEMLSLGYKDKCTTAVRKIN